MRLKQYINELSMKKNTDIDVMRKARNNLDVKITLEGGEIFNVSIYFVEAINKYVFPERVSDVILKDRKFLDHWIIEFSDVHGFKGTEPKDRGVSIELFAALTSILKDFNRQYKPNIILFGGWGESKLRLYETLAKKIAKEIKGKYLADKGGAFYIWKTT